ncbi:MAG: hypothetical protein IJI35_03345 [Kiritimatiellae bacterium]|nr:hypothetical protein [Kiritimatiellia bacterium]
MKRNIILPAVFGLIVVWSAVAAPSVDFARVIRPMKPEHGIGQPPKRSLDMSMFHYLKEAGIPYSRLHDVGGWHGQNMFVDIPNVFRDFDADENDPANYEFEFTDILIKALVENDVEPVYRLGITIENFFKIKRLRSFPPKDYAKWARICEHVIRHYTEGWANGFHYKMTYWEIWNEADRPEGEGPLWSASFEEFCRFYEVAARHLKAKFPHLKIGGFAATGLYEIVRPGLRPRDAFTRKCVDDFFAYVKAHGCPLDFFSIHAYDTPGLPLRPDGVTAYGKYCREGLDRIGYGHTELSFNEWLPRHTGAPGSAKQAAMIAAILIALQDSAFDTAMIYDGRVGMGLYSPLFSPETTKPRRAYWAMCDFNELYRLGSQVAVNGLPEGVYAIAATDGKGVGKVFAANVGEGEAPFEVAAPDGWRLFSVQLTDEDHLNTVVAPPKSLPADSFAVFTFVKTSMEESK